MAADWRCTIRRLLLVLLLAAIPSQALAVPELFSYEQTGWRSSPPDDPCFEEDDGATWQGYGRVAPDFSLEQVLPFCETVGGVGFFFLLVAHTDAFAVEIVSPSGLRWPLSRERSKGDWIISACVGDDHGSLDGQRTGTIETGDWLIRIVYLGSRPARDVRLQVQVGQQNDQPNDPAGCVF